MGEMLLKLFGILLICVNVLFPGYVRKPFLLLLMLSVIHNNFVNSAVVNQNETLKNDIWGSPGGPVVESVPADAGDTGSCPGPGRFHVPRSGWAREPWPLNLRIRSLCSATGEATTVRGPHLSLIHI